MALYRKKPVVIEATQWQPDPGVVSQSCAEEGKEFKDALQVIYVANEKGLLTSIDTLEGRALLVSPGDWIITGVKGEKYPCKPDIFEATYEAVQPGEEGAI
jgi:hypothetical protein